MQPTHSSTPFACVAFDLLSGSVRQRIDDRMKKRARILIAFLFTVLVLIQVDACGRDVF